MNAWPDNLRAFIIENHVSTYAFCKVYMLSRPTVGRWLAMETVPFKEEHRVLLTHLGVSAPPHKRAPSHRLREAREARGWTVDHMCSMLGMVSTGYYELERGKPAPDTAVRDIIAEALGVHLECRTLSKGRKISLHRDHVFEPVPGHFGHTLRCARIGKGMIRSDLAKESGISRRYIISIERMQNRPPAAFHAVDKMAVALGRRDLSWGAIAPSERLRLQIQRGGMTQQQAAERAGIAWRSLQRVTCCEIDARRSKTLQWVLKLLNITIDDLYSSRDPEAGEEAVR